MRKSNSFDIKKFLKEEIGDKGIQELGLSIEEKKLEDANSLTSIKTSVTDKQIFVSSREWKKLNLPLPTF